MELNYETMFKSAVAKLQTDAQAYNELLRKSAELNMLWFDSEGNAIVLKDQEEQARQVRRELNVYIDAIATDLVDVATYRELAIADGVRNRIENEKEANRHDG